jgi:hypothetical protein
MPLSIIDSREQLIATDNAEVKSRLMKVVASPETQKQRDPAIARQIHDAGTASGPYPTKPRTKWEL